MNIHGLKQQLIPIKEEIKKGVKHLGVPRYNKLVRKRTTIKNKIKKMQEARPKKKKK